MASSLTPAPIPDDKYHFEDGDCMFLVENMEFKVHKVMFSRDPDSMFRTMFSLPQNSLPPDTIRVSDSLDDFRGLCWILYAMPADISQQSTPEADVPKLLRVVHMAHKYGLGQYEKWALHMLALQCKGSTNFATTCAEPLLENLLEQAEICGAKELHKLVINQWITRLSQKEFPAARALALGE
uniref:BTB domain-containing protein n=1 Tax=Mycena chlorophos TaxID=658473 RepID=A0ABQ0KWS9_MYCCL|nr:predicted protein [Mycena chlorophos]